MISFKAQYICSPSILQKDNNSQYSSCNVSFVELEHSSPNDKKTLVNLNKQWNYGGTYVNDIVDLWDEKTDGDEQIRRFAITTQQKRFANLNPKKILGVVEVSDIGTCLFINFLQTNPKEKYKSENRKFKDIGKTLIESIKNLIQKKTILLSADMSAIPFYKKLGFKIKNPAIDSIVYLTR